MDLVSYEQASRRDMPITLETVRDIGKVSMASNVRSASKIQLVQNALVLSATCFLLLQLTDEPTFAADHSGEGGTATRDDASPVIVSFERFFRGQDDSQVLGGELLFNELNCASCHDAGAEPVKKQAPRLSAVGSRIRADHLREYLNEPHKVKPGTTMPSMLADMPAREKDQVIESLVHLLASTGRLTETVPRKPLIESGERLFHSIGCVACHQTNREGEALAGNSVPLPEIGSKYTIPSLSAFLKDPLAIRPSARMPHFNLSDDEARDISNYLLSDIEVDPNVAFRYYEGDWQNLPDFAALDPTDEGVASSLDVRVGARLDKFGVIFTGYLRIDEPGEYTFFLGSDDGSRLLVDKEQAILIDGIHPVVRENVKLQLEQGVHRVDIEYFEQGGEEELYAELEGPGLPRSPLDGLLRLTPEAAGMESNDLVINAELVKAGAQYFSALGCANCHELEIDGGRLESSVTAKPIGELSRELGALSQSKTGPCPDYGLDEIQQESIRQFIAERADSDEGQAQLLDANARIHQTMMTFNCYSCHQRGELGGVPADRNEWFVGEEPEMGDEGRIPPPLTGVGAKLNPSWLKSLLNEGAKDRPYMLTRMPKFGAENVDHLVAALGEVDSLPEAAPEITLSETERRVKVAGRVLVGRKGLSCIQCHTWGATRSTGIQAMSLTTMTRRLSKDWFQLYMLDANRFRPGTRMPNSWPRGKTYFPELLDGDTDAQIHSVWAYLSDEEKAARPEGLEAPGILLKAETEPVIYRNFIEGGGTRAIGVGYPESVNVVFDANELVYAMLWQGDFIDASRHWRGRGQGWQPPAGENILNLASNPLVAMLDEPDSAWPEMDAVREHWRFRGYRFDEARRPAFRYDYADDSSNISIEDQMIPRDDEAFPYLQRQIAVRGNAEGTFWLQAASGSRIEKVGPRTFQVDDWQLVIPESSSIAVDEIAPTVVNGKSELRLPLELDRDREAQIELIYRW